MYLLEELDLPEGRPVDAVLGFRPGAQLDLLDGHDPLGLPVLGLYNSRVNVSS